MRKVMLIAMTACALSACGSSNNSNSGSSSSSGGSSSGGSSSSSGGSSSSGSSSSGGSSGGSSSGSPAQGIYCGSFTNQSSSSSSGGSSSSSGSSGSSSSSGAGLGFCSGGSTAANFFGLVQADGTAELFGKSGSVFILFQPAAASLTGTTISSVPVTAYGLEGTTVNGSPDGTDTGTLSGSVTAGTLLTPTTLTGTLTDTHGISLNFNAQAQSADWNTAASLSSVAGSYTGTFSLGSTTYSPSLTVSSTGGINGSDSGGCNYTGQVTVVDASHNDYNISITSTCIGTFSGVGAYFSGANNPGGLLAPAVFKMGLVNSNGSNAIFLSLTK